MVFWENLVARWQLCPFTGRAALIALAALVLAQQLNRAIDRWAYHSRGIDPWRPAPEGLARRGWLDRLPLVGWWRLRREAEHFGRFFWLRPLLIELSFPLTVVWLYDWEMRGGLYPTGGPVAPAATLHAQFVAHVVLYALMVIATFIDFDEQTIPDEVTVSGTALALLGVSVMPVALLPTVVSIDFVPRAFHVVATTANHQQMWHGGLGGPFSWPPRLDEPPALWAALACLLGWWLAVLPKIWTMRKGLVGAVRLAVASVLRYRTWRLSTAALLVMAATVVVAYWRGGYYWQAAFSSVVGLTAGGGFTWLVRLVASRALGVEALGFGDVTLMAMIGALLGWQCALLVFFFAPLSAVIVAVAQWVLTRRHDIAFGPYLCLAACGVVVGWRVVWYEWALPAFGMGWMMPAIVLIAVVMLGVLLAIWQWIKRVAA